MLHAACYRPKCHALAYAEGLLRALCQRTQRRYAATLREQSPNFDMLGKLSQCR